MKMFDKKFIKNLFGFSTISWLAFIVGFIATLILTRVYNPSELGAISIFLSLTAVYQVTVSTGQDQYIVRKYYEQKSKSTLLKSIILIEFFSWVVLLIFSITLASFLSRMVFGDINNFAILACAIISFPLSIFRIVTQISKLENNIIEYGAQVLTFNLLSRIVVIGIGFINKDYNMYILWYSITVTIVSVIFLIKTLKKNQYKQIDRSTENKITIEVHSAVKYGFPIMISSVIFIAKDLVPRIVLRQESTLYDVGILGAAMTLASSINIIIAGFNTYFSAYYFENYKNDTGQIDLIHHILVFILVESIIILSIFSPVISYLVGENFRDAGSVFPIIALFSISQVISETTVHGINVKKKTYLHIIIAFIVLVAIYFSSKLLVVEYGVFGIAVAYSFGGLIFYFLRTMYGQKNHANISHINRTHISLVLAFGSGIINHIYYGESLIRYLVLVFTSLVLILMYKKYIIKFYKFFKYQIKSKGKDKNEIT